MIDNYSWITVYPEIVLLTLACVIALVDLGVKSAGPPPDLLS
jgi:NADH-quinone oxidoreductase subunit N